MATLAPMEQPFPLDNDDSLDFSWNWTLWLAGRAIASFTLTSSPDLVLTSASMNGGVVTVWVSLAGELPAGRELWALCEVTTDGSPVCRSSRFIRFVIQ